MYKFVIINGVVFVKGKFACFEIGWKESINFYEEFDVYF